MMGRVAFGFLILAFAATARLAAADEAVIRGGSISYPQAGNEAPAYSGSSMPRAARTTTTILRGSVPANQQTPASDLGGDIDGPIYRPPCLYTEPPTCR
jgi:hypothetical protein